MAYTGNAFVPCDHVDGPDYVWYATQQTRNKAEHPNPYVNAAYAVVNYKGTVINVRKIQEIYDPETREILRLQYLYRPYPWGYADATDNERMNSTRK